MAVVEVAVSGGLTVTKNTDVSQRLKTCLPKGIFCSTAEPQETTAP